ncbi:hypothetical protein BBJ28_00010124 [Nothophytophthora sp. Chile5]|nr:hypothetical protein BBJ28_00010124 [Nothophytophthora sp. Chile5]
MRSIGTASLDSWLFGEDKNEEVADSSTRASLTAVSALPSIAMPPRNRKPATPSAKSGGRSPVASDKRRNGGSGAISNPLADLSYPFPVSSKLRKLFRPNRLQWKRPTAGKSGGDKQRQLVGLDTTSFQRLQGHVPFSLKEIVKDPKKLPFLLQWLSVDTEIPTDATHSNYHQVLLFLMEIEQLQTVDEDKRREQALKIWHKYIDNASEFQIATTLELTPELEQLVFDNIDSSTSKVLDSFFPIQKLAYMRLTREEMPRFLKSDEYLKMLIATEDGARAIPMERILQQRRAAHYFLLFLMQSRQHFELYFWLHVEYVLKPVLEDANYALFWRLAHLLVDKAQNDSQAITLATKNDLYLAVASRRFDEKLQPPQPVAKALFDKAQQEIFAMLRSSWFDRFTKSDLYKVALKDSLIQLSLDAGTEDSPPKLLSRAFSSMEYTRPHSDTEGAAQSGDESENGRMEAEQQESKLQAAEASEDAEEANSESDSEESAFSRVVLNLESIIRLTKLPDGLQVHYCPNFESPGASLSSSKEDDCGIDTILTFATFVEKHEGQEPTATLMLMPVPNPRKDPSSSNDESFEELSRRVKTFLVPSGRILIKRSTGEKCPGDMLFPFQQSGRNGFLFGSVYLTYESMRVGSSSDELFVAKGFCLLSRLPLVNSLRKLVEEHVTSAREHSSIFAHDRLTTLFQSSLSWKRTTASSASSHSYIHPEMRRLAAHRQHSSILSLPLSVLETRADVSMTLLFEQFGSAMVLQILASAVLECSIVLVASQYSLLTMCAEAIRNLLRPFSWCHVYAPVLPKPLLSYLQCPTPILVGVHSDFAVRSDLPTRGFYLVADADRKVVDYVGDQSVAWRGLGLHDDLVEDGIFLPRCFEAAKRELDSVLFPRSLQFDSVGGCGVESLNDETEAERDEQVRIICFELFSELLRDHTNACLVVGDTKESVVIFDETEFLSTRADEELPFYRALLRTQCFSEIVSAHRINMSSKEAETDPQEALEADDDLQEGII